jgi:inosose dehydratase
VRGVTRAEVAYNPLPWALAGGGFDPGAVPPLRELGEKLRAAGFDAIQADVPEGVTAAEFGRQLDAAGLRPAPGYFHAAFESGDELEAARRVAAQQAELGLTEVFLACALNDVRVARPGTGTGHDADRLARIAEHIGRAARAMAAEGVRPCLHPHVGTWIETAGEAEAVLDAVDPAHLLLGPDNGHLAWAGADPVAFVARHADRVGALHVKDVHQDALEASRRRGDDFFAALRAHVVAEPGRGDSDLAGLLAALGDGFAGWIVIEVDVFDLPTPEESVAAAGAWVRDVLRKETASA